jgi:hypothetical protein
MASAFVTDDDGRYRHWHRRSSPMTSADTIGGVGLPHRRHRTTPSTAWAFFIEGIERHHG